ncbi:hypothetical protein DAI22_01g253701 [Oryza sativa Japonica Group]|nr:hypothetical protein DAI22_01g253701 [Oryza sativa Japonica Group]
MHRPLTNPATTALLPPPSPSHCRSPPVAAADPERGGVPAAGPPPVASRRCHPIPFAAASRHYRAQREMRLPCITPLRIWRGEEPGFPTPPHAAEPVRHHQIHRPHLGVAAAGHRHHPSPLPLSLDPLLVGREEERSEAVFSSLLKPPSLFPHRAARPPPSPCCIAADRRSCSSSSPLLVGSPSTDPRRRKPFRRQPLSLDTTPTSADPIRVCIIGPQSGQRRWTNSLLRDMEQQTTSYEELDGGFCAYYCGTASLVPLLAVASISLVNNRFM